MKKTLIDENWEEILVDDLDSFYALVFKDEDSKASYVKTFNVDYDKVESACEDFKAQFDDSENRHILLYIIKLPNAGQIKALLEIALYNGSNENSPEVNDAVNKLLNRMDCEVLAIWKHDVKEELEEAKKRKKKLSSYNGWITWTTGNPDYNIKMFNKRMGTDFEDEAEKAAKEAAKEANTATEAGTVSVSDGVPAPASDSGNSVNSNGEATNSSESTGEAGGESSGDAGTSGGEGGTMGESLELTEAKRYVKRYYIRPQNIFCSNKEDILKALVKVGDENCSVYSLKSLSNHDDVHLLKPSDIIYYYDDGVLYDKNHVKVMDYDLFVKHEEERKKVGNVDTMSDAAFADEYEDRLTDADLKDNELRVRKPTHEELDELEELEEGLSEKDLKTALFSGETIYLGYDNSFTGKITFNDKDVYSHTAYFVAETEKGYEISAFHTSASGEEIEGEVVILDSFEKLLNWIKEAKLEDKQIITEEKLEEATEVTLPEEHKKTAETWAAIKAQDIANRIQKGEEVNINELKRAGKTIVKNSCGFTWGDAAASYYLKLLNDLLSKAGILNKVRRAQKRDMTYKKIGNLTPEELKEAAEYLEKHIIGIKFYIPKAESVDAIINRLSSKYTELPMEQIDAKAEKLLATFNNYKEEFFKLFPEAVEERDYHYRKAENSEDKDPHVDLWHMAAVTTFDEDIANAPSSVIKLMEFAQSVSKNEAKDIEEVKQSNTFNSYYFALAVLKMFDNDLGFYNKRRKGTKNMEDKFDAEAIASSDDVFKQDFTSVNAYGEKLSEGKEDTFTCCICGEESKGYGNNPDPVKHDGRCCDACNAKFVIPARIAALEGSKK